MSHRKDESHMPTRARNSRDGHDPAWLTFLGTSALLSLLVTCGADISRLPTDRLSEPATRGPVRRGTLPPIDWHRDAHRDHPATIRATAHRGLSLAVNAGLTRWLSILAGPIGIAMTALWTTVSIAGPAYRVTMHATIQVAKMRLQLKHPPPKQPIEQ